MTRLRKTASALAGIAFLAIALGPARAEETAASAGEKEWNQEEVTAIAKELASSVSDLRAAFRRQGSPTREQMQGRAHHQMVDDLRLIRNETAHLARQLEAGKGRDETLPIFRRLGMLVRNAQAVAPRLFLQQPVMEKIAAARKFWDQLRPYYPADASEVLRRMDQ